MRSMGVLRLYWIAQHICLSMSKLPMAWRIPPWPSPVNTGLWLTAFVTDVRKADGDYYSPASLNELLSDFWTFSDFKRSSCVMVKGYVRLVYSISHRFFSFCDHQSVQIIFHYYFASNNSDFKRNSCVHA